MEPSTAPVPVCRHTSVWAWVVVAFLIGGVAGYALTIFCIAPSAEEIANETKSAIEEKDRVNDMSVYGTVVAVTATSLTVEATDAFGGTQQYVFALQQDTAFVTFSVCEQSIASDTGEGADTSCKETTPSLTYADIQEGARVTVTTDQPVGTGEGELQAVEVFLF